MTRVWLFGKDFVGCSEAEAISWPMIKSMHREGDRLLGDRIEAHLLRKELMNEAIHVFVCVPLPRGIGVREEEASVKLFSNPFVLGKLLAVPTRQRINRAILVASPARSLRVLGIQGKLLRHFRRFKKTGLASISGDVDISSLGLCNIS